MFPLRKSHINHTAIQPQANANKHLNRLIPASLQTVTAETSQNRQIVEMELERKQAAGLAFINMIPPR